MSVERPGAVTLKGNIFTLLGPELKIGEKAPDFLVIGGDLKPVMLSDTEGIRVFSVVPSLDTPVCDQQTRRFNQEAGSLLGVKIYTVSMDLPFAQGRWCAAAEVDNLTMLSDHRDSSFGSNYGTLIKELRLNCRAIFVVDEQNNLSYVEYVGEMAEHPDYDAVFLAVKALVV